MKALSIAPFMMLARLAGAGAGFLAQLVLARLLPPEALGKFFAATSLAAVLGVIATQGYPGVIQRFVTRYRRPGQTALLGAFVGQVQRETLLAGSFFVALVTAPAILLPELGTDFRILLLATAVCVASATACSIYPPLACADRRFALGLLPETFARPIIFLCVTVAAGLLGVALSAGTTVAVYAAISAAMALIQFAAVPGAFPSGAGRAPVGLRRRWRQEAWPLLIVLLFTTLFADVVILLSSPFLGAGLLAPFGIALKISMLIGFIVQVTHQVTLPDLAEAHQRKDKQEMLDALLRATLLPVLLTTGALVVAILWGDRILRLFGPDYAAASVGLVILIAAQLIRAIAGPAPLLLTLGGAQKTNAAISVATCGVLIVANLALTTRFGLLGACFAVVLAIFAWTGLCAVMLRRRMNTGASLFFVLRHAPAKTYAGQNILHLVSRRHGSASTQVPLQIDG
jgi:O-antigen/teichoic acid export membrane protein